ncbi:MAG: hypothetical protein RR317_07230, partial [Bilophila sp.]
QGAALHLQGASRPLTRRVEKAVMHTSLKGLGLALTRRVEKAECFESKERRRIYGYKTVWTV